MVQKQVLLLFVMLLLLLSGCTGKREINELSLVMAVGIDKVEDSNEIELTITVARPADARGQTGAPAGNTGDPIRSASATGKTLFEAIRNQAHFATRRIFWAHNFIIIISEDVARDGIKDIIDFFTRNPELRMRTWVAITPNKAKDVISTMTGLEVVTGEALDKLFRHTKITGAAPRTDLIDVQAAYLGDTTQPMIARMKLIERGVSNKKQGQAGAHEQVSLEGAGVFKGDKLVGVLEKDETVAALLFTEKVESGVAILSCPNEPEQKITAELVHDKFSVTPAYKNGKPAYIVDYNVVANIVEAGCSFSIEDEEDVRLLEMEIQNKLKADIKNIVQKAQKEYKSDFLEFGQRFNNKFPAEWKELKEDWDSIFSDVTMTVNVNATVKSGVLLYNPTRSGKK